MPKKKAVKNIRDRHLAEISKLIADAFKVQENRDVLLGADLAKLTRNLIDIEMARATSLKSIEALIRGRVENQDLQMKRLINLLQLQLDLAKGPPPPTLTIRPPDPPPPPDDYVLLADAGERDAAMSGHIEAIYSRSRFYAEPKSLIRWRTRNG